MFTAIGIALGGAFVTGGAVGYALACARVRADVETLRARYRDLIVRLRRLEITPPLIAEPPAILHLLPGGRRR